MAKDEKIFTFRVSSELLEYLKARADRNKRSIAKELEYIVEQLMLQDKKEIDTRAQKIYDFLNDKNVSMEEIKKTISTNGSLDSLEQTVQKLTSNGSLDI